MKKIGIGITTYHRPEHLQLCLRQLKNHTHGLLRDSARENNILKTGAIANNILGSPHKYFLFIAKDIPNIAKAKNECLYNLKDCDHIFLFDDDCFPIADGWVGFFVNSGEDYLLYLTERHNQFVNAQHKGGYYDCGGCFIYMTKKAFEKTGYFNYEYKQYGFEHAGHAKRFNKYYFSLKETKDYIYSLDYQGEGNWGVKHKPSITDYKAMQESIDYNRKVFEKEITSDKIYYDYEKK